MANSNGQVLHFAVSHGQLPDFSKVVGVIDACTRRLLRFFGWRRAINEESGDVIW